VDNENQNTLPNWLLAVLEEIWGHRQDWFFGVDMAIYDRASQARGTPLVIPDGFLSVGVIRHKRGNRGRLSYVLQEEDNVVPLFALEMVSKTYGEEYGEKLEKYERLGVKYYLIYNWEYSGRNRHQPFELYKLEGLRYRLQPQEPYWIPELGLGIGRVQGQMSGIEREWLSWHDQFGRPYPLPLQVIRLERQRAEQERQRAEQEWQRAEQERQRAEQEWQRAEQERQRAEQERQRAEQERQRAEQERQRAEQERQRAEQERQRAEWAEQVNLEERQRSEQERQRADQAELKALQLLEKLRQLGVDPDT
jgi:hypothetical protein